MTTIVRMLAVMALMLTASLAQAQNKVPSERALEALVKTTLLTFNDANVTGNYEVFHAKLSGRSASNSRSSAWRGGSRSSTRSTSTSTSSLP